MILLLLACTQPTLQPVIEARAAAIAADAAPTIAFAMGGAGLVSAVCADTHSDWRSRAGEALALSAEVAALLGRSEAGQVLYNDSTGLAEVLWSEDEAGAQLRFVVDRPQSSFILRVLQAVDTGAPEGAVELRYSAEGCREAPVVGVSGGVEATWLPAALATELPLQYAAPGEVAPIAGALTWQDAALRGRGLTTEDAAKLSDWAWPAVAAQSDWTWPVSLTLIDQ